MKALSTSKTVNWKVVDKQKDKSSRIDFKLFVIITKKSSPFYYCFTIVAKLSVVSCMIMVNKLFVGCRSNYHGKIPVLDFSFPE